MRLLTISAVSATLLAAGCSERGSLALMPEGSTPAQTRTVLVASSRTVAPPPAYFGEGRSYSTNFTRFEIAIPPGRAPGELEYPSRGTVDPDTQFLVASATPLDGSEAFGRAIDGELRGKTGNARQGVVFIHGFNTNNAEGIMRATALMLDTGREGVEVVYSWPSAGKLLKYLDDRESALFARDGLRETLAAMSRSQVSRYLLVAHSMGTFVAMDTMRELALMENRALLKKIGAVILISADLDIDVFRKQAPPVLAAGVPIVLLTANDDLALTISSKLRGQGDRVGDIKTRAELQGLEVTVFDLSEVTTGDPLKHFKIGSSPAILDLLKRLNQSGESLINASGGGIVVTMDADTLRSDTGVAVSQ